MSSPALALLFFLCACVSIASSLAANPRIINGLTAERGQFPWQALLSIQTESGGGYCGGSLLSSRWVLTAGHCVEGNVVDVIVGLGFVDLLDTTALKVRAGRIIRHPNYIHESLTNDLALIYLSAAVTFSDFVQPIKLASSALGEGVAVETSGWGKTTDAVNTLSEKLNYVNLVTITNNECVAVFGTILLTGGYVCARGTNLRSTCLGDSGGPLITRSGSEALLVGTVSFVDGRGCAIGSPSGYTRIAPYRNWIRLNTGI